ncbi:hypothetical protein SAMN05421863_100272 [Nitrosomonas communis]|uniref:Uncharacterized protein n=1 Tax=Nitrosomonas communis TaxID=44574 RepID=A0A1I4JII6_9PROT|nr:hypothetical protein SAMN05421863_100272 [Nitrosomonas communis]
MSDSASAKNETPLKRSFANRFVHNFSANLLTMSLDLKRIRDQFQVLHIKILLEPARSYNQFMLNINNYNLIPEPLDSL